MGQIKIQAGSYRPAQSVIDQIKRVELLIVVGPSGVGKSSLIDRTGIKYVPSDTTREPRAGEVDGKDMFFRDDYDNILNELSKGEFVQVAIGPAGDFYATRVDAYPKNGLATMPVVADVVPVFRQLGFKRTYTAFIVPPSYEAWMQRMDSHNLKPDQLNKRLNEAKRSFRFALNDRDTHFILNDDLDIATQQIKKLSAGIVDREKEELAKETAHDIYARLLAL